MLIRPPPRLVQHTTSRRKDTTSKPCTDTIIDLTSQDAIDAVWVLTQVPKGFVRYNKHLDDDGGLTLRNGVSGRRGGAAGSSYVSADVPHCFSVADVSVSMSAHGLRTAADSCVFQASGDNGATWTTVLTLNKFSPPGESSASTTIAVAAGDVTLRLTTTADGKREKCHLHSAEVTCPRSEWAN